MLDVTVIERRCHRREAPSSFAIVIQAKIHCFLQTAELFSVLSIEWTNLSQTVRLAKYIGAGVFSKQTDQQSAAKRGFNNHIAVARIIHSAKRRRTHHLLASDIIILNEEQLSSLKIVVGRHTEETLLTRWVK